jgi:hypothetical protein
MSEITESLNCAVVDRTSRKILDIVLVERGTKWPVNDQKLLWIDDFAPDQSVLIGMTCSARRPYKALKSVNDADGANGSELAALDPGGLVTLYFDLEAYFQKISARMKAVIVELQTRI